MYVVAQPPNVAPGEILQRFYSALFKEFGPQSWWPARTRLEVILGAMLTQNTAWHNASLALKKLRAARLLTWPALRKASLAELEDCVRSAGFYRQKARTIRTFADWLDGRYRGSLNALFSLSPAELRSQLLELKGLGPETVDAIILYAGRKPSFVADAYTRRVLARHRMVPAPSSYQSAQSFLHKHLPADAVLFNEFHALLVEAGKRFCRLSQAHCEGCPLEKFLSRTASRPQAPAESLLPGPSTPAEFGTP